MTFDDVDTGLRKGYNKVDEKHDICIIKGYKTDKLPIKMRKNRNILIFFGVNYFFRPCGLLIIAILVPIVLKSQFSSLWFHAVVVGCDSEDEGEGVTGKP